MVKGALYWHDGGGFGHLSRQGKIGRMLLSKLENMALYGITGSSEHVQAFIPEGMDIVKLPSFRYLEAPKRIPLTNYPFDEVCELRRELVESFFSRFLPDFAIIDHEPRGWRQELQNIDFKKIKFKSLGFRGILDNAEITLRRTFSRENMAFIDKYDKIFIYNEPGVFDFDAYYKLPASIKNRMQYTGYILPTVNKDKQKCREELKIEQDAVVIVSQFGGGQQAERLINQVLEVIDNKELAFDKAFVFLGPYINKKDISKPNRKDIEINEFTAKMLDYMRACDVFIGAGGYNTICEVLKCQCKSILFNRHGHSSEQSMHIKQLEKLNIVKGIYEDEVFNHKLSIVIRELLNGMELNTFLGLYNSAEVIPRLIKEYVKI